ncbi:tetratricopeptide repeat protein [Pseudomonadota bacterium]
MAKDRLSSKFAVILHADVAGSTALVQQDEQLAHERIQDAFHRFSETIEKYQGHILELRGDALLAQFERPSDAVAATLAFQSDHTYLISRLKDDLRPTIRVGIAMGEVVIADNTVTGSGVVLAQRVEQLTDPGGVCITAALHESLPKRMPFNLENLGEQVLKGFDDPVRVYRVELTAGQSIPAPEQDNQRKLSQKISNWLIATIVVALVTVGGGYYWFKGLIPQEETASVELMAYPLPDKPSIAVLPFSNLSDDKQQEYFADGMTEDLITDISKISGLFVIARNSVFTYKGKAVKVRQVAEDLGVRYVMEGSVRRVDNQVRINAQLIDTTTGGHLWAERYDGSLDDVFSMQDKIIQKIVASLSVTLVEQEQDIQVQAEVSNTEAHDAFLRGWERYRQGTPDDFGKSVSFFELAIELDPDYAQAHAALAAVYWDIFSKGWWKESLGVSYTSISELARNSLLRSQQNPTALTHQVASESIAFYSGSPRRPLNEARLALELDPNSPSGYLALGNALLKAKKPDEAESAIRDAMRLDPHYSPDYLVRLAQAQFHLENYESAVKSLEKSVAINPEDSWAFVYLSAAYGQLDFTKEAQKSLKRADELRADAGWAPITIVTTSHPYFRWQGKKNTLKEGLRAAGAPNGGEWLRLISENTDTSISHSEVFAEVKGVTAVDVSEAHELYERGALFVHTHPNWFRRRIPGSINLEWWQEGWLFNEVALGRHAAKDREIVIYAHDRPRRWVANPAALAVSRGFENVYQFPGGIDAWAAAGYPIETDK